jgi:thiol:disulfide interchange protein DsbD
MKGAFIVPTASAGSRFVSLLLALALILGSGWYFIGQKFAEAKTVSSVTQGDWKPFTPQLLEAELKQRHAVFVDFTAAWCLTCKFNEANVLESAAVREAFQRHGVTKIKADWTNADPAITKILKQFGRPGVPMYVLYPGDNAEPILFPELLTQSYVLEKLETVSPRVAAE